MVRIIVLILLLGVAVQAQSPRLDSIQTAIAEQLGMASTTGTARAINRAYVQVCADYDAYEKFDTLSLTKAAGYVSVPSDYLRMHEVNVLLADGVRKVLRSMIGLPQDSVFNRIGEEYEGTTDSAKQDEYTVRGSYLYTYPRWLGDSALSLEISYFAKGSELDTATDSIEVINGFYNAVFWYSCAEVQQKRGRWTDALNYRKLTWAQYGPPKGGIPQ